MKNQNSNDAVLLSVRSLSESNQESTLQTHKSYEVQDFQTGSQYTEQNKYQQEILHQQKKKSTMIKTFNSTSNYVIYILALLFVSYLARCAIILQQNGLDSTMTNSTMANSTMNSTMANSTLFENQLNLSSTLS
ncbi:hypothetical protein AB837_00603 [bacterium AB1]|nr:hypothetical protein AB837_00603 [bacterium AB1]